MKHLILAGILAMPVALVACQGQQQSAVDVSESSVVAFDVTGMT
jgi:hypothetical protein